MAIMMIGFTMVLTSDAILLRLSSSVHKRQHDHQQPSHGYSIPRGMFFQYWSTPHFVGECLEWIGFATSAQSLSAYSFALWTMANLLPRAIQQHAWYQQQFPTTYPPQRCILFPGIW